MPIQHVPARRSKFSRPIKPRLLLDVVDAQGVLQLTVALRHSGNLKLVRLATWSLANSRY